MGALHGLRARLRALVNRRAADRALEEEIRFHLAMEAEKYERLGLPPAQAQRRARIAFGGVQQTREAHREVRGVRWAEALAGDVRFALRTLRRNPLVAGTAITTLALGIGATAAVFSAVNAVVLRPLPFPHPGRLVMLWESNPEKGWRHNVVAPANYLDWRAQVSAFADVAAYTDGLGSVTLTGRGEPAVLRVASVTGNFFAVLGVRPERGRAFTDAETWQTTPHPVVLADRAWRRYFGADPAIVGRTVRLDGRDVRVVGVAPPRLAFPTAGVDLWASANWDPTDRARPWFRRAHWLRVIARLRRGVSLDAATAQLQAVARRLQREYPATNAQMGAGMTPLHDFLVGDTRPALLVALGAAGLLLLIACANIGNLLLVRAAAREHEMVMRLTLGASRRRLARQVITESLVLSAFGGAAGTALGWAGTRALGALQPAGLLPVAAVGMDGRVLAFAVAVTTGCGLLFGLAPALWSVRRAPADAIREGGRGALTKRRMTRWGDALVVCEVALALLLTVGAGLLVRSLWRLQRVPPGFDSAGVLTVSLDLPGARYDTGDRVQAFYDALLARVRALPGVVDAAVTSRLPLTGTDWTSDFAVAGRPAGAHGTEVAHREVSSAYLRTMHIPLLAGRAFTDADRRGAPWVVLINHALATTYFKGQNPIGQRITFDKIPDSTSLWRTIVGVVGNEHQRSLAVAPKIEILAPFTQQRSSGMTLVARTRGDPAALAAPIRQIVAAIDPALALLSVRPLAAVVDASLQRPRFLTLLLLVFAAVGLVLAVVGVYGVMAQLAHRRTREMGIRMALGARARQVRWMLVRHGLRLLASGLVLGAAAALIATRAMRSLLFDVAPSDPATFAAVAALLGIAAVLAALGPAARASRTDPASTLRVE